MDANEVCTHDGVISERMPVVRMHCKKDAVQMLSSTQMRAKIGKTDPALSASMYHMCMEESFPTDYKLFQYALRDTCACLENVKESDVCIIPSFGSLLDATTATDELHVVSHSAAEIFDWVSMTNERDVGTFVFNDASTGM